MSNRHNFKPTAGQQKIIDQLARDVPTACLCIGPQNGQPLCPCKMRNVKIRDGRYIQPEVDLGPVPEES